VHIDIRGDATNGWYIEYLEPRPIPHMKHYTGPFWSRPDAARAIPDYRRDIERIFAEQDAADRARRGIRESDGHVERYEG
jgi:hypothetical protein